MSALRKHKILSALGAVIAMIVLFAILGAATQNKQPSAASANTAAVPQATHSSLAAKDPRWLGLGDCLTQHHLPNGSTDSTLSTYAVATSAGDVVGNVTYSRREEFKYGPISYTFAADPSPPSIDEQNLIDCVVETFGPHADSTSYVRKYLPSEQVTELRTAPTDPRWAAMKRCFGARGLRFNTAASTPTMVVVGRIGLVTYGHIGGGTRLGPVSYGLDYSTTSPSARAFMACVTSSYRATQ